MGAKAPALFLRAPPRDLGDGAQRWPLYLSCAAYTLSGMEKTREKIEDLQAGEIILVGYSYDTYKQRHEAHLFGLKTTAAERSAYGYAAGTIRKIEKVRKSDNVFQGGKYLWLTIDGVPGRHLFVKWSKATVVHF